MPVDAESLIRETFHPGITDKFVQIARSAYDLNIPRYYEDEGDDMMLFGLMNYKTKVHKLCQLHDASKGIKVIQRHPKFFMEFGSYRLSTYCAGHSTISDPMESFPQNRCGAADLVTSNILQMRIPLILPNGEELLGDARCRNIVLADIGNPQHGLIRLFLGVPIRAEDNGRISEWGTIVELYSADTSAMHKPDARSSSKSITAPEPVAQPIVTLKPQPIQTTGNG